jgi:UDP-2,4-diacetamido-2,4,6-trideoxy-beta-L-altropyranose hydrolase
VSGAARTLLVRADASALIGAGHVMRCLALTQAWQDAGGKVFFASRELPEALRGRLERQGIGVLEIDAATGTIEDARATCERARSVGAGALVVDGYPFNAEFQGAVREAVRPTLVIDDHGQAGRYDADFVLDQNLGADTSAYEGVATGTRLLLGPRFALLRREFRERRRAEKTIPSMASRVLVTLGGGDPGNATLMVMRALDRIDAGPREIVVAVGGANERRDELAREAERLQAPIRVQYDVGDMPALMAWADVAVSAGGSTCWELAFMGVPGVTLVQAENQRPIAERLDAAGIVLNLGRATACDEEAVARAVAALCSSAERRETMSRRGRALTDGRGGERVVEELLAFVESR